MYQKKLQCQAGSRFARLSLWIGFIALIYKLKFKIAWCKVVLLCAEAMGIAHTAVKTIRDYPGQYHWGAMTTYPRFGAMLTRSCICARASAVVRRF